MTKNYKMLFCEDNLDYEGNEKVEIAKIINIETKEDVMFIYYDKRDWLKTGLHLRVEINTYTYEDTNESKDYPVVIVDERYRNCFKKYPKIFESLMMHELGHFVNGDLYMELNGEEVNAIRWNAMQNNQVVEWEAKADIFAVNEVGKSAFINVLDYLIRQRKERNDAGMAVAIKEFELRKQKVKRIK